MSHTPPALPKAGSGAWKEAWAAILKVLDAPRTVLVVEGALDRKTSEELVQKLTRGAVGRLNDVPRAELVGRLADVFLRVPDAAWAIARELDRAAHKERFIVASIAEESVQERIETYRAIDFRRERARLIWALLRDGREAHRAGAERILAEAFEQMGKSAEIAEASAPVGDQPLAVLEHLKERLQSYEQALEKQQKDLQAGERAKQDVERERSELLVRIGQRERALRDEEKLRRDAEAALEELRGERDALAARVAALESATSQDTIAELEQLRERARALESKVGKREAHAQAAPTAADVQALGQRIEELARTHDKERARLERERDDALARVEDERRRVVELRDELRAARQALSAPAHAQPSVRTEARIGVFVDAANLSASARRDLGSKLDYRTLLEHVLDGRKKSCAVAFVVKEGEAYGGFAASLRDAGYELFEKVPKARADGSKKADWDMGIAMEILDRAPELDVIVLCSGDGDYLPLLKRLKRDGRRVEVAAFRSSTDEALVRAADAFVPLDGRFRMTS